MCFVHTFFPSYSCFTFYFFVSSTFYDKRVRVRYIMTCLNTHISTYILRHEYQTISRCRGVWECCSKATPQQHINVERDDRFHTVPRRASCFFVVAELGNYIHENHDYFPFVSLQVANVSAPYSIPTLSYVCGGKKKSRYS